MHYKEVINEIRQAYNKKNSILKETEIHISINEAVKNDLEIIYEEIGTLKNEKLTLTKNIESLKNALKSLGIDEIEKELDRLSNIISTYPHSISLLIESKAKREANIKNYIDRLNELEINLNTKNKELNFYKENFRYELNLGYIEELKALEECEAIEYVIEKYKLSESYKQNDIISNIHEIIRESSLELNNYNIGVYDTDNIYTNYEDENIKGLVEISKRVDIRIKLHKKEISLYDLIKKLNLNIEEHNLLINENERKVFEDILINNLSTKISARISRAKNWVKEIDKLMDKVNTSTIVAIATTAGTGTEADPWTVITKEDTNEKIGFGCAETFPVLSVVDPEMMLTIPAHLTAYQGFDALFHATEGYIANVATPLSDAYALKSIELLAKYLPAAVKDGSDLEARTQVALASTLSGMVESTSCCTSEHGMEHALSAFYPKLPHGAGLIMLSEAYYSFFADKAPERFTAMAKAMGVVTGHLPEAERPMAFVKALVELQKACGVDGLKMSDYGITKEDMAKCAGNARHTMGGLFELDPYALSLDETTQIMMNAYK